VVALFILSCARMSACTRFVAVAVNAIIGTPGYESRSSPSRTYYSNKWEMHKIVRYSYGM
jgi:hypothetical protein